MPPRIGPLTSVLRPPSKPVENAISPAQWASLERGLGTALPSTYKKFLETYGTGSISRYVRVPNPFSRTDGWLAWVARSIAADESARAFVARSHFTRVSKLPGPPFPAPEGLLPFADWDTSVRLHYWMRGSPEEWPIVWAFIGSDDHLVFELPLTTFLDQVLRGRLREVAFGAEYLPMRNAPKFVPGGAA